jgi:AraC family transcriptional regulator
LAMNGTRGGVEEGGKVRGECRCLHGGIGERGLSLEWHSFRLDEDLEWGRSFHPLSLEVCVNYQGIGRIGKASASLPLGAEEVAVYSIGKKPLEAVRSAESQHRFFTFAVTPGCLGEEFRFVRSGLRRCIREFVERPDKADPVLMKFRLPPQLLALRTQLLNPPVPESAREFWYHGKVIEVFSHALFCSGQPSELFCEQQRRLNRERCERALFLIERDMQNPPSLEMLAGEVGCSPFHLSRVFSEITGQTIPAALRNLRIQRAASLLHATGKSVTEIAFEVGYSSIGAFNKAFGERFGSAPSDYRKAG